MITCLKTELHKSGYVGFKFWQVDRVAGTARIFLAYVSPHLPKRGRVRLHVGYPFIRGTHNTRGTKKVVQRIRKTKRTKLILQPSPSWEVIWRRHGTLIGRNKSACRCDDTTRTPHRSHTRQPSHTAGSSIVFIFRALRPCDQNSPISVWKPVYLLRAFVYTWMADGEQRGRVNSVFIRLFERNTHLSGEKGT